MLARLLRRIIEEITSWTTGGECGKIVRRRRGKRGIENEENTHIDENGRLIGFDCIEALGLCNSLLLS